MRFQQGGRDEVRTSSATDRCRPSIDGRTARGPFGDAMTARIRRRPGATREDRWELTVDLPPHPVTGKRRRLWRMFTGSKRAPERELARLVQEGTAESFVEPPKGSVRSFLERWLREYVETGVG